MADSGGEQAGASPLNGVVPPPQHRFKPGQSGNPKGKPKGTLSRVERQLVRALSKRREDGRTLRQIGAEALAEDFADGDPKARELVFKADAPATMVQGNVGTGALDDVLVHVEQTVNHVYTSVPATVVPMPFFNPGRKTALA